MKQLSHIRVCLDENGTTKYWPQYKDEEDYADQPLRPAVALHHITGGNVPLVLACRDPLDRQPHNYQTLFTSPDSRNTSSLFRLRRI